MPSRTDQFNSVIHRAVQDLITRGLNDPRVRGLISVTRVNVSNDLADAVVHVSVLPAEHAALSLHGLQHAAPHIRHQLADALDLRRVPRLEFRIDESIKKASEVYASLHRTESTSPDAPSLHVDEASPEVDGS